jgi:hypothetical protein
MSRHSAGQRPDRPHATIPITADKKRHSSRPRAYRRNRPRHFVVGCITIGMQWGCGAGGNSAPGSGGGSPARADGGAPTGGAATSTGGGSPLGGGAAGGTTANGGGIAGGSCNAGCGGGGTSVASGGSGDQDPFVLRLVALCDTAYESIRTAPGCPDLGEDWPRRCVADRREAKELGCSFEPVLDCADEHPDGNKYFCDGNGIQALDLVSCAGVLDAYNACVLAAKGQQ